MVQVKICGITNVDDALGAADAGADFLGFVFYPPSPRYVSMARASEIIASVRRSRDAGDCPSYLRTVGVFVDEKFDRVVEAIQECDLDYAQLHGGEAPDYVASLGGRAIKAVRVRVKADVKQLASYQAAAYLLDAYHPTRLGGTGQTWDWELASAAKRYGPVIVAGGLTSNNVADVVRCVNPYGVDTSSGVESRPGRKDIAKVRRFVIAAKAADSGLIVS